MDLPVPVTLASTPPFVIRRPLRHDIPVVFASAHSGSVYPADFISVTRLDPLALRRSEDSFVDELFAAAPDHGCPLLAATFPRAFCDANREPWELDPVMFSEPLPDWVNTTSARVGAGLGTIARIVASGEAIYRSKLSFAEAERRVQEFWQPYHAALRGLIEETRQRLGICLLVDCHSMPAAGQGRAGTPDIVLGDAHGTACAAHITRLAERVLTARGYAVRRNDPYAGGYVTRHYGRPRDGVHVLQIEIARRLYMDEKRIERLPAFGAVQQDISALIAALAEEAVLPAELPRDK